MRRSPAPMPNFMNLSMSVQKLGAHMEWHEGLASKAQEWSGKCVFKDDPKEDRVVSGFRHVGQNIAGSSSVLRGFTRWFEEHRFYNLTQNTCSGVCGHYTQLVWAETKYVGCGVTKCPKTEAFPYDLSIVCNYGEA
ncbi:unnamed protein product [Echinostoma caproni]|uniref:SCP domain-containing protein n=1 Tax=Echinostoma caproni TaxID=27848 RepID=A0A183AYA0_9TREM|nr:unnamed protein product [Echinostoma caproni]